jgi:DNA-binding MarR family transcriptional regulator
MSAVSSLTGYLAWQFARTLGGRMEKALGRLGLTLAQYNALERAFAKPSLPTPAAARRSGFTAQSMGAAIGDLVERGLMERQPHPTNGRIMRLYLTDSGQGLAERGQAVARRISFDALQVLSDSEQDTIYALLHRLVEDVNPDALPPAR